MKRTPVQSSNIASIGYDSEGRVLEVEFNNGRIYQYYNVPLVEFQNLMGAGSHGKYLAQNIIDHFRYTEI